MNRLTSKLNPTDATDECHPDIFKSDSLKVPKLLFRFSLRAANSTMTQTRFSNLTILNTHKQRTDKLCLIDVANEFAALNENRKSNFATFKESDLKMSG